MLPYRIRLDRLDVARGLPRVTGPCEHIVLRVIHDIKQSLAHEPQDRLHLLREHEVAKRELLDEVRVLMVDACGYQEVPHGAFAIVTQHPDHVAVYRDPT